MIDLLALERILPLFGNRIRLNIVTGDLYAAIAGMHRGHAERLRVFMDAVPHSVMKNPPFCILFLKYEEKTKKSK